MYYQPCFCLFFSHPYEFKSKENIRKEEIKMERLDRFGFSTVDPIGEGQRISLGVPDDEMEISLEELSTNDDL